MLVYVIALLIVIWFVIVTHRSGGNLLVWPLLGLASYFGTYWAWRLLFLDFMVRDAETLVWFLVFGMLLGLVAATVVLATLLRGSVANAAANDTTAGSPVPIITPPKLTKLRYVMVFGVAVVLAEVSVVLQMAGAIHNEFVPGGMIPAGLAGAIGGAILRRPLRSLLLGVGLGLTYAVCYAPGLHLIGKLSLQGGESGMGALIGLPLLMIIAAVPGSFLGAVCARSIDVIRVYTGWLADESQGRQ